MSIFEWRIFPAAYIEGSGQTTFKITSEYIICGILAAALAVTINYRKKFNPRMLHLVAASIVTTILSELAFTHYISVYGGFNMAGHLLKVVAFYFLYVAVIEVGLKTPFESIFRDLKASELSLRESEERYRSLVELSPDAIAVEQGGRLVYMNAAGLRLLGLPDRTGVLGADLADLAHPDDMRVLGGQIEQVGRTGAVSRQREARIRRRDGRYIHVAVSAAAIVYEDMPAVQVVMHDITGLKRAEEQLKNMNENLEHLVDERTAELRRRAVQLQEMALELTQAESRERRRIAHVLHDDLQQILAGAKIHAGLLAGRAGEELGAEFQRLIALLDDCIAASRSLTVELSTPVLYEEGLGPALKWLASWAREKFSLEVSVTTEDEAEPASEQVRVLLFQAVRELLFNVVKHAGTSSADLELLRLDDHTVVVRVADDGVGFDPTVLDGGESGFGLFSIRERLSLLGGSMHVESAPGRGTAFTLTAPAD